jgi:hypothetical protein
VRPEGLGTFKKNHLIGYRSHDLPVCITLFLQGLQNNMNTSFVRADPWVRVFWIQAGNTGHCPAKLCEGDVHRDFSFTLNREPHAVHESSLNNVVTNTDPKGTRCIE